MARQAPRNGLEAAQFADEGRGTLGVYKKQIRYTDNASGHNWNLNCKSNKEALTQVKFFEKSWEAKKARDAANNC